MNWYQLHNEGNIDSPALLIFPDRIRHNIQQMIAQVGGQPNRLMPHVKTHKMREVIRMQLDAGIRRFKCATIAELEMCLEAGAPFVLMAYQLVGPKLERFLHLAQAYPHATVASLVDNLAAAQALAQVFGRAYLEANIYLDVNNGQNRTGHPLNEEILLLYRHLFQMNTLKLMGLHVYDGHIRDHSTVKRKVASEQDFQAVYAFIDQIANEGLPAPEVISGGSPAFSAAAMRSGVYCSPGTTLLWDAGYAEMIAEIDLKWAALLMTRVISKPAKGLITTDLGHKSVASENPLHNRIRFLNLEGYEAVGHSEEHLVLKVKQWETISVGDVFYGVPYHICPTVALYNRALIVRENRGDEEWEVYARGRGRQVLR